MTVEAKCRFCKVGRGVVNIYRCKDGVEQLQFCCTRCNTSYFISQKTKELQGLVKQLRKYPKKKQLDAVWKGTSSLSTTQIFAKYERIRNRAIVKANRDARFKDADPFFKTDKWRNLRKQILARHPSCCKCGSLHELQVDHIKPRSKYPELQFDKNNLQVLCKPCNKVKSNIHKTDYRTNICTICLEEIILFKHPKFQVCSMPCLRKYVELYPQKVDLFEKPSKPFVFINKLK